MKLDLNRVRERLGQEQDFTFRAMAEGYREDVSLRGWRIGTGTWADPPGSSFPVLAITTVAIYVTTDGDLFGVLDQYPQPNQPLVFGGRDNPPMWIETGDTLDALRARLYERNPEHHATDLAITEAQQALAPFNQEETP